MKPAKCTNRESRMEQEQLTPQELKLRAQENTYIQEGKTPQERTFRTRVAHEARKDRAKKLQEELGKRRREQGQ